MLLGILQWARRSRPAEHGPTQSVSGTKSRKPCLGESCVPALPYALSMNQQILSTHSEEVKSVIFPKL